MYTYNNIKAIKEISQKENKYPATKFKSPECQDITDEEFTIAVTKKFSEVQENLE